MPNINSNAHKLIGLGGTFDHFHKGHEAFLQFASKFADKLIVGITSEEMVANKNFAHTIQSFEERFQNVKNFLQKAKINAEVIKLSDPYGPTINDEETQAIFGEAVQAVACTQDTYKGAEAINQKRAINNLSALPIYSMPLIKDQTGLGFINSTRIRKGEINRDGFVYQTIFAKDLILSAKQKEFFSQIQGVVVSQPTKNVAKSESKQKIIVVGDYTFKFFLQNNYHFDFAFYDLKTQREDFSQNLEKLIIEYIANAKRTNLNLNPITLTNPAGRITKDLTNIFSTIDWSSNSEIKNDLPNLFFVDGEEDLAAVAGVVLAPLNTLIYYGQRNIGMVEILVTEGLKEKFIQVLKP